MDQIAITRTVTVAAGPFAAGHLGELTRLVPFEMVDDVLAATRRTQQRVRLLPARVVVYLLVVDGTILTVADSTANLRHYVKQRGNHGGCGYPSLRLSALLACGTRSMLDAVFDPVTTGEITQARRLTRSLRAGMLLLADRNYAAAGLITTFAETGADLLIRCKTGRKLPLIRRCHDGSWLSVIGSQHVRVIEARISIATTTGSHTGDYRLITTLLDAHRYPAADLARLYHQRWEIETAYLELKSTILGGRVLRARTPDGVDQEIHALLIVYQVLRTAMVDATDSRPGLDPDRASFTTALNAARDQVTQAAGVIADTVIDLVGVIGERILANLLPDRRIRTKTRMIKRSNSKYQARGPNVDRRTYKATTSIDVVTDNP